jgi:peptidyl-prolyl cis-trans isomerase C
MKPAIASVDSLRATILGRAASLGLTDGASEEEAIERLLDREVRIPEPTEDECRRHYENNRQQYTAGEIVECDHILFAVTPGVPVPALRSRAELMLLELRTDDSGFAAAAAQWSNCPSSQLGGNLGQLTAGNSAPEFFKAISEHAGTGVMPTLVRTRHGFHIVRIRHRVPGSLLPFEVLHERIAASLVQQATVRALTQYVAMLSADEPGLVQ